MSHRGMGLTLAQEKRQVSANYGIDKTGFFAAGGLLAAAEKDKGIRAANEPNMVDKITNCSANSIGIPHVDAVEE